MKAVSVVVNWALPLDDRLMLVKVWSYERVRERQRDGGYRIIPVIADVGRAWHDTAADLRYVVMVCRRATLYRVHSR